MPAACKRPAPSEEDLEVRRDFKESPEIEHHEGTDIVAALSLGENLPAQSQLLAKIALELPSAKRVIALVRSRIDGITASPVSRPGPPTLLQP